MPPNHERRTFFIWAVLLALIALFTHSAARGFLEDSMHRGAARLRQVQEQHITYAPDPQAVQSGRIYNILTIFGLAFTATSLVCMVVASVRRESGWYLLLMLLLFADIIVPMLL